MDNVSSLQQKVNGSTEKPTVEDVVTWIEAQAGKADIGAAGARIRVTSLKQMAEQIAPDETHDAQWALDNMERLRERWVRRNLGAKADTALTYASRAGSSIREYFRWIENGGRFDPFARDKAKDTTTPKASPKKQSSPKAKAAAPSASAQPEPQSQPQPHMQPPRSEVRNFPLGGDRGSILFELPPGGILFADVKKFAVHLFTLASDFDISDATQAQVFSIVVRGPKE